MKIVGKFFILLIFILSISFSFTARADSPFNGDDREPPRVSKFEVTLSPSEANDWRILITLKTSDDKNVVNAPTLNMKVAFPWKTNIPTPAPKCLKAAQMDFPFSTFEQTGSRVVDNEGVKQTFIFIGRVPIRPTLENSCPEFRNFSLPPVVSLNGGGITTSYNKNSSFPIYQGSIFEPKLEDASGRIYDPKRATNAISSTKLLPIGWPVEKKELCLSQVSTDIVIEQKSIFQTLDEELARAIEIGNPAEFPEVSPLQITLKNALELKQIVQGETQDLSSFPLCSKMIDGRALTSQLKATISKIKRSNDDYLKNLASQLKQTQRENASKLAEDRNSRLSDLDEVLKNINAEYAQLSETYSDLTRVSSIQKSKTSFGAKEKATISSKAIEDRKKLRELISVKNLELLTWNSKRIAIERESEGFTDNLSKSYYQKAFSKYELIRVTRVKIISLLLRFDQLYTKLAS